MTAFSYLFREIVPVIRGRQVDLQRPEGKIANIATDSRKIISPEHCLFFALVTNKNDGHQYVDEVYERGIRNFVVSHLPDSLREKKDINVAIVDDPLSALQALASWHRNHFPVPVIGITGSNGKTIVKEWLFQLMSADKKIVRSPMSYNSQVGVPLSVWQMNPEHDLAIFEAGISEPGEMENLRKIIRPAIGVFTNIGPAHSAGFADEKSKIREKLILFHESKSLVYCPDYHGIREVIEETGLDGKVNLFTWSFHHKSDLQITGFRQTGDHQTRIDGIFGDRKVFISIPFSDAASVENAIHCWAVMLMLGYDQSVISGRMHYLQPVAMRLELKEGINQCAIINDSYNSDISSLGIALDFLSQQNQRREKVVILSDILQSGQDEDILYTEIARLLQKKDVSKIIGIGPALGRQAHRFRIDKVFFPDTSSFLNHYPITSFNQQNILIKGARVFEFERISKALQQKAHETVLRIDLNAMINNLNYFRSHLDPGVMTMAMVKAFSYGSGSYEIAGSLQYHHVDYLAVAYVDEGVELRKASIHLPVMVMNPDPGSFDPLIRYNLEPEIYNFRVLEALIRELDKIYPDPESPVKIHLKLDTGMHRLGFEEEDLGRLTAILQASRNIRVRSVFSHLAASEDPSEDDFTRSQISLFRKMGEILQKDLGYKVLFHILNSAGIARFPEAQFDMVRLGISLYGIPTVREHEPNLENVSTLRTVISQIKTVKKGATVGYNRKWMAPGDTRIGIIPVGYADGFRRSLGNGRGRLFIRGTAVPVVGNVCMDMCMADLTGVEAEEGDEVIIFGKEYPITQLAKDLETIPYEVLTGISRRVKRVYFHE